MVTRNFATDDIELAVATPEPGSLLVMGTGLLSFLSPHRRKG